MVGWVVVIDEGEWERDNPEEVETMPVQKTQSSLFNALGGELTKAYEQHKNDETVFTGGGDLPGGINGGVAQLVDCRFMQIKEGKQNAGQWMFYAAGVVKVPKLGPQGEFIEGLRTSITEPLFSTPDRKRKTIGDHYAWVMNELAKLGIKRESMNPKNIEQICAYLKQSKPHFKFHTFKGEKQTTGKYAGKEPLVTHMWDGKCDWSESLSPGVGVADNTASANGSAARGEMEEGTVRPDDLDSFAEGNGEIVDETESGAEGGVEDLTAVAEAADAGDGKAAKKIYDYAISKGMEKSVIDDNEQCPDWATCLKMANEMGGEGESEEEAPEPTVPEKGNLGKYKAPGVKGKPLDVEVLTVNTDKQTVTLKNLSTGKPVAGPGGKPLAVKWDAVVWEE